MTTLIIIVAVAALVALGVFTVLQRRAAATPAAPVITKSKDPFADMETEKSFWSLKAGDLVKFEDEDFFIRRSVQNVDGNYRWVEHRLDNGTGRAFWLSIEDDEGLDLGVWDKLDMVDIEHDGKPGDPSLVTKGKAFKLKESGQAQWSSFNSDENGQGTMNYLQYEAADRTMLALQQYDTEGWQASLGVRYRPSEFDIYPASIDLTDTPTKQGNK